MGSGEDPWVPPDSSKTIEQISAELYTFYSPTYAVHLYERLGNQWTYLVCSEDSSFIDDALSAIDEFFGDDVPAVQPWANIDLTGEATDQFRNAALDVIYFHNSGNHSATVWLDAHPLPTVAIGLFAGNLGRDAKDFARALPNGDSDPLYDFASG